MQSRRHLVATLVSLAVVFASVEQTLVHTDDGCAIETHCNACLLQLGTPAVVAVVFTPPRVVPLAERVASPRVVTRWQAEPRRVLPRGPPAAPTTLS